MIKIFCDLMSTFPISSILFYFEWFLELVTVFHSLISLDHSLTANGEVSFFFVVWSLVCPYLFEDDWTVHPSKTIWSFSINFRSFLHFLVGYLWLSVWVLYREGLFKYHWRSYYAYLSFYFQLFCLCMSSYCFLIDFRCPCSSTTCFITTARSLSPSLNISPFCTFTSFFIKRIYPSNEFDSL